MPRVTDIEGLHHATGTSPLGALVHDCLLRRQKKTFASCLHRLKNQESTLACLHPRDSNSRPSHKGVTKVSLVVDKSPWQTWNEAAAERKHFECFLGGENVIFFYASWTRGTRLSIALAFDVLSSLDKGYHAIPDPVFSSFDLNVWDSFGTESRRWLAVSSVHHSGPFKNDVFFKVCTWI